MKSLSRYIGCLLFVSLALVGCQPGNIAKPKVPMANPPVFGSKSELSTWKGFIVGRWGVKSHFDDALAKQLGLQVLAEDNKEQTKDEKVSDVINFKEDGSFRYTGGTFGHKIEGEWKETGQTITLSFTKIDDKPYQDRMAEIQKAAEGGTQASLYENEFADWLNGKLQNMSQLRLSDDKKELIFIGPSMAGGIGDTDRKLVRLEVAPQN